MATILDFLPRIRTVSFDIGPLLYVPAPVLDKHLYAIQRENPAQLPFILRVVHMAADALAPGKTLPPDWDAESAQARRAELLSVLALYPCAEGESQERPTA